MKLSERMKEYEMQSRTRLLRRTPVIIRLDGCHFHTWTKGLNKPYDMSMIIMMQKTMKALCEQIQGCVLGYTQSDEITLVLVDYQKRESMAWYDNQVQKICSVAASIATNAFNQALEEAIEEDYVNAQWWGVNGVNKFELEYTAKARLLESKRYRATFDARAFNIPMGEVINNLIWRQQDATRNSINLLAQSLYSHKELQGINSKALQNKMLIEKNVKWDSEPIFFKRGSCCIKDENGKWCIDALTPIFTQNRDYVNDRIFIESE